VEAASLATLVTIDMQQSLQTFPGGPDPSEMAEEAVMSVRKELLLPCTATAPVCQSAFREPHLRAYSMQNLPALRYSQGALGTALKCDLRLSLAVPMSATLSRGVFPEFKKGKEEAEESHFGYS
jgi:hypothetical protein